MYSCGPSDMAKQKQDDQLEHTYSSYVRIRDVTLKTCQKRWMIGRSGERGAGISVLAAQHDDDEWWKSGVEINVLLPAATTDRYLSLSCFSISSSYDPHFFLFLIIYFFLCWTFEKLIVLMKTCWNKDKISFLNPLWVFWFIQLQSCYSVHFQTITLGKDIESLYPSSNRLHCITAIFITMALASNNPIRLICQIKHRNQTNEILGSLCGSLKLRNRVQRWFGLVSLFNGISTFVGYLMPKPFSKKNSSGTI